MTGRVIFDGEDLYGPDVNVPQLRRRVGMVFALPLPLPGTIRENVLYGLRLAGIKDRARLDETLEKSLTQGALWMRSRTAWMIRPPRYLVAATAVVYRP